jgi:hypothetical protein
MKRVIVLLLIAATLCCLLVSCAQPISEEIVEVDAVITNVQKRIRMVSKTFITDRDIYFEYGSIAGSWDVGYKTYNAYKDREGKTIKCYLITYTYEDGSTKVKLVAKEDYDE